MESFRYNEREPMTKLINDPTIIGYADIIRAALDSGTIQPHMVNQMMITAYRSYVEDTGNHPEMVGDPIRAIKIILGMNDTP